MNIQGCCLLLLAGLSAAWTIGFETNILHPDMKCLKNAGYVFAVIRCFQQEGRVDANCEPNVQHALDAGLNTDVYIHPCFVCGNPEKQADDTMQAVVKRKVGRYWVVVFLSSWSRDVNQNREFITRLVAQLLRGGQQVGINTIAEYWAQIVGPNWTAMSLPCFLHSPILSYSLTLLVSN